MITSQKGIGGKVGSGEINPLSITPSDHRRQWDFSRVIADEKGSGCFPLVECVTENDGSISVIFSSLDKDRSEVLHNSTSIKNTRIPRSELNRLVDEIEKLHRLAEASDVPSATRDFLKNFVLPNPHKMPEAWRISGKWKKRLHILWGYSPSGEESVFFPQSFTSKSWTDANKRQSVHEICRGLIGGRFFTRVYWMIFLPIVLAVVAFFVLGHTFPVCQQCHKNRMFYKSGLMCSVCKAKTVVEQPSKGKVPVIKDTIKQVADSNTNTCQRCGKTLDANKEYCQKHYCSEHDCLMEKIDGEEVCPKRCKVKSCGKHGDWPNQICSDHDCSIEGHGNNALNEKGECTIRCQRCNEHKQLYNNNGEQLCATHYCFVHEKWKDKSEDCPIKCKKCSQHATRHELGLCEGHLKEYDEEVKRKKKKQEDELRLRQEFERAKQSGIKAYREKKYVDAVRLLSKSNLEDAEVQYYIGMCARNAPSEDEDELVIELRRLSANQDHVRGHPTESIGWAMVWLEKSASNGYAESKKLSSHAFKFTLYS